MLKKSVIAGYIALTLSMSLVFAAEANSLDIFGIAYVSDFRLDMLPIFPLVDAEGSYFSSANLPVALTHGDESWVGDTFYLSIVKPPSVANHGQNQFTMTFNVMNPTNYVWTSGQAAASIKQGVYSTVGATLSAATVNPGQKLTITFSFKTKIDITSYDQAHISVSYIVGGVRRYVYINVVMRPV